MKLVFKAALSVDNVPPIICFTDPACRSMHGLKCVMVNKEWFLEAHSKVVQTEEEGIACRVRVTPPGSILAFSTPRFHQHLEIMALTLGKRKRNADVSQDESDDDDARALFRRAFEAKFKPLAGTAKPVKATVPVVVEADSDENDESDWTGLSENEDDEVKVEVEVVDHGMVREEDEEARRREMKAFMVRSILSSSAKTAVLTGTAVFEAAHIS